MTDTPRHDGPGGCRDDLAGKIAALSGDLAGTEVTISAAPPIVASPYGPLACTCPHGVTYWIEPTGEQIAQWRREGAA